MSAESGLKTFRDSGGLWEEYNIEEVATPEAWKANPGRVLNFYNLRRKQVINATPNAGHFALVRLEELFHVDVITQNIDDLHERAGSSNVLHLHGEVMKSRAQNDPTQTYPVHGDLNLGDLNEEGAQLRPHVVWFGEEVPAMAHAIEVMRRANVVLIVGTSLNVYPAASLIHYAPKHIQFFVVDPNEMQAPKLKNLRIIRANASKGIPLLVDELMAQPAVKQS